MLSAISIYVILQCTTPTFCVALEPPFQTAAQCSKARANYVQGNPQIEHEFVCATRKVQVAEWRRVE